MSINDELRYYCPFTKECWTSTQTEPEEIPIENVGIPKDCQDQCSHEDKCMGVVHQFFSQKCWLMKNMSAIKPSEKRSYVGPKVCPSARGEL